MYVSNMGREQIDNFMQDVDSLTPARVRTLVDKHFPRKDLQIVLIGKAAKIRKIAAKYGTVTELDITRRRLPAALIRDCPQRGHHRVRIPKKKGR